MLLLKKRDMLLKDVRLGLLLHKTNLTSPKKLSFFRQTLTLQRHFCSLKNLLIPKKLWLSEQLCLLLQTNSDFKWNFDRSGKTCLFKQILLLKIDSLLQPSQISEEKLSFWKLNFFIETLVVYCKSADMKQSQIWRPLLMT